MNRNQNINIKESERFLKALCGDSTPTFQTFDDDKDRSAENRKKLGYDPYAKVFHGNLDIHNNALIQLQMDRAGCFIMVNEGDGIIHDALQGQKKPTTCRNAHNVVRVRAAFVDLDGAPLEPIVQSLKPHIIVESSPGRYHAYWKMSDCPIDKFTSIQKAIIKKFNGDRSVHDIPRVMRVPGFIHQKGEAFETRIIETNNIEPYTLHELVTGLQLHLDNHNAQSSDEESNDDPFQGNNEGGRTKCIERVAGILFHRGFRLEEAVDFCETLDATKNSPPLKSTHPGKVRETVEGIHRRYYSNIWQAPVPLPEGLLPVKPLDPLLIPEPLRDWNMDIADRMEIPPDFSAVAVMTALGSVIGRACGIKPKQRDNWTVVPNLWGGVIARPSMKKTPATAEAMKPLDLLEKDARDDFDHAKRFHEYDVEVSDAKRHALRKKIGEAIKNGNEPSTDLRNEHISSCVEDAPTRRRYFTSDATPEAIIDLLKHNPRGILIKRDELIGWFRSLDKDGRENARALFLEGWNGTGGFTYDTIGRGTKDAEAMTLSVFGAITPGPLSDYVYHAAKGGGRDDGLLQRFQLLVWPDALSDWKNVDRWPNTTAKIRAYEVFKALAGDIPGVVDEDGENIPCLRFSPGGQEVFDDFMCRLETRLRSGEIRCSAIESHLAKYRSLMPSLALVIHLVNVVDGIEAPGPVSEKAAVMADGWCEYLETHAARIYGGAVSPDMESAREIIRHIRKGEIQNGCKPKEIYRRGWSKLNTPESVRSGLKVLEDYDWLTIDRTDTGGRPSEFIRLNPMIEI